MFFQPSPILPQASGLGFAFDNAPDVRNQFRHGAYPFLTGRVPVGIHSGVRRTNASTGRMGGQRRTSWIYGVNGLGEAVAQPAAIVDTSGSTPIGPPGPAGPNDVGPATVSRDNAVKAVEGAATAAFFAGGVMAALPAVAVGLLAGYLIWGRNG